LFGDKRAGKIIRLPHLTNRKRRAWFVPNRKGKIIPIELIVTLKPGAKIVNWQVCRRKGPVGRIPGLNAYRLQFDDATAANCRAAGTTRL